MRSLVTSPRFGHTKAVANVSAARGSLPILGLTSEAFAHHARERVGPGHGVWRQVYRAAFEGRFAPEELGVSSAAIERWRSAFHVDLAAPARRVDEPSLHPVDVRETAKVALRTHDGLEIESVRIPMSKGRSTLCLSSQVGCRLGCRFCETGRLGLLRNLTPEEIVGQVVVARSVLGWRVDNLVFMGMGEPLDNAEHLVTALRVLTDSRGLAFGQQKITVCTSGVPEGLRTLGRLGFRRMGLSFSLNAATDAQRDRLMPINRRHPLAEMQRALKDYPTREGFVLALNYCLLPGWNDAASDAEAVARFVAPLGRTLVNVIPYNPGTKPLTRAPTRQEVDSFVAQLRGQGLAVRERKTKGRSVMAACGQLGNLELREVRRGRATLPVLEPKVSR
ncbi:MAG: radical SAM protein [Myxococcota bacterium]